MAINLDKINEAIDRLDPTKNNGGNNKSIIKLDEESIRFALLLISMTWKCLSKSCGFILELQDALFFVPQR